MDAAVVGALPPSPSRIAAWLARTRLAAAAADAVICLYIASMWLLFGALAAMKIGQLACGEGCLVVTAAAKFVLVAGVTLLLAALFGVLPLVARSGTAEAATDIEAAKCLVPDQEPAPRSLSEAMRELLRETLTLAVLTSMAFGLLVGVGALLEDVSPAKGSLREMIGSAIGAVGALGMDTVNCFVVAPIVTVRIWRAWRMIAQPCL